MDSIRKERPRREDLERMGVANWPIREKEVSESERHYDEGETCCILEGRVRVEPRGGAKAVGFGPGDLVTFPEGLDCTWKVTRPVRKHNRFG